jgi:hypothetical protein
MSVRGPVPRPDFGPRIMPEKSVASFPAAPPTSPPCPRAERLNEKQLAERWDVSVRTLQAARVRGTGVPFVRIGRAVRYRMEDVLDYEQSRLRTSTSES